MMMDCLIERLEDATEAEDYPGTLACSSAGCNTIARTSYPTTNAEWSTEASGVDRTESDCVLLKHDRVHSVL